MERPDRALLIHYKEEGIYCVFATWSGGYLHGDSWKRSTEIKKFEYHPLQPCTVYATTRSGNTYQINLEMIGSVAFGWSVLSPLLDDENVDIITDRDKIVEIVNNFIERDNASA